MSAGPFLSSSWYRVAGLRPKLREHASISRHRYRGSSWYVVHDPATGRAHRLSTASYMIVGGMDGTRTVDQLWHEAVFRLKEEAPSQDELIQLMAQLHSADLLQTEVTPDSVELLERSAKMDRARWIGRPVPAEVDANAAERGSQPLGQGLEDTGAEAVRMEEQP